MSNDLELQQKFITADGKLFDTKAEAQDYQRRPKIQEALGKIVEGNQDLVDWLTDNRDAVTDSFSAGTIKRVSKSEKNKLEKALKAIVEANDPKFAFVAENHEAVLETFRWPKTTRMNDEEKAQAVKLELTTLADGNEEVADFVIENKDAILESFEAGKVKRAINDKAKEGLARYQAQKKAEREAAAETAPAKPAKK